MYTRADLALQYALSKCPISWDASIDLFYFWTGIACLFIIYRILDGMSKPKPPRSYPPGNYPPHNHW